MDRSPGQRIIDACLAMHREGINQGSAGNISVRTAGGFLTFLSLYDNININYCLQK